MLWREEILIIGAVLSTITLVLLIAAAEYLPLELDADFATMETESILPVPPLIVIVMVGERVVPRETDLV